MIFEPGPIVPADLPLGPRVATPGLFEGLAAPLVAALRGTDQALRSQQATIGELAATDLGPQFNADVVPAFDALAGIGTVQDDADLVDVAGAIDAAAADVQTQQQVHPGPDEPQPPVGGGGAVEPEPTNGGGGGGGTVPPPVVPPPIPDVSYDGVRKLIRGLYLELLFREPDEGGWEAWTQEILTHHHDYAWVRARIMESDEYRQKHGG